MTTSDDTNPAEKRDESHDDVVVLRNGFIKLTGTRYEAVSGPRIRVQKQKQMHKFGSGYQSVGPLVPLFTGNEEDAKRVYHVLREWFGDD